MSCSGKTYFANLLEHQYFCFDAIFPWHQIETLGLSTSAALENVSKKMSDRCIVDGWHLSDIEGKHFPEGTTRYVIYCSYKQIIDQYRVEVVQFMQHFHMYEKWYPVDFKGETRYFRNNSDFVETSKEEYLRVVDMSKIHPEEIEWRTLL